ncbi:MAG: glycosyltransferase family 2 protein [Armatimonadota bacterium]|nr:glycosyltransferase family 2 protein [Armatimonadota bacterium]
MKGQGSSSPFLSIVIPAYNEARRLPRTLESIHGYLRGAVKQWHVEIDAIEVIVVDDGSTDGTSELAKTFADKFPSLQVLRHSPNKGKGYAVKKGMLAAKGQFRLFSDADLSTPIDELDKMLPLLLSGEADIVIASRGLPQSQLLVRQPWFREMLGRMFNLVVQALATPGIWDTQCGFKLFRGNVAEQLFKLQTLDGFAFDVEILYLARKFNYRIAEIPVRWLNDPNTKVQTLKHGTQMLCDILKVRWNDWRGVYKESIEVSPTLP